MENPTSSIYPNSLSTTPSVSQQPHHPLSHYHTSDTTSSTFENHSPSGYNTPHQNMYNIRPSASPPQTDYGQSTSTPQPGPSGVDEEIPTTSTSTPTATPPPSSWTATTTASSTTNTVVSDPYRQFASYSSAVARESAAASSYFSPHAAGALGSYAAYAQNMMNWNSYSMASFQNLQRAGVTYGKTS